LAPSPKKSVKLPSSPKSSGATVAEAAAAGRASLEAAALLDHLGEELHGMFVTFDGKPPPFVIDDGTGSSRPATIDAVVVLRSEIARMAAEHRKTAQVLLGRDTGVGLPGGLAGVAVPVPTVVHTGERSVRATFRRD
jgi:hypothetical protein